MAITLKRIVGQAERKKKEDEEAKRFLEEKSRRDAEERERKRAEDERKRKEWEDWISGRPSPVSPADVAFEPPGRGGPPRFAGPGAARERERLGMTLTQQEAERQRAFEAEQAQERAPDITTIMNEVGKVIVTGDVEKDKLSYEQAIKSALAVAGPAAAGTAALVGAGALAGGVTAPAAIPLAAVGGAVGFVTGLIAGMRSNLKTQRTDMVKGESQNLMKTEQNMLKQVMLMNQLPRMGGTTDDMVEIKTMFDEQMALTDENYQRLEMETSDDLSKWLGEDGHKQLEKYENFNNPGGMREILIKQMTLAINSPDLGRIPGLQAQVQTIEGEMAGEL